jgi:hypothetical protein
MKIWKGGGHDSTCCCLISNVLQEIQVHGGMHAAKEFQILEDRVAGTYAIECMQET